MRLFAWCVRALRRASIAAVVGLLTANIAVAQPVLADGPEARRQVLFLAMLEDPTNLDVAFEYAMLSAQVGDYEAAIATLERMLVFAPNLDRVKLELGVLYYRIGAEETAESYLNGIDLANAPEGVQARVANFRREIARQARPITVSGVLVGGVRYQSNANSAPSAAIVTIGGLPVVLDDEAREQADVNAFALANAHFAFDLQNQGDLFEVDIATYNSAFVDLQRLNLNLIEVSAGPSFTMERFGLSNTRVGVYGIAGATALDYNGFATTLGVGARAFSDITPRLRVQSLYEFRDAEYYNSNNYPTIRDQTGPEFRTLSTVTYAATNQILLSATGESRFVDAKEGFRSFSEHGGLLRATYAFFGPDTGLLSASAPWTAYAAVGGLYRGYYDPDPLIDATDKEQNWTFLVEAGVSAPLEGDLSVFLTGQYRDQQSSYEIRDYSNLSVSVGLAKRF